MLKSYFAVGSDATMTIGGRLSASSLLVSNNLNATVGVAGLPIVTGKIGPVPAGGTGDAVADIVLKG